MLAFECSASSGQNFLLKVYKEAISSILLGEIVRYCLDRLLEILDFSKLRSRWTSNFERIPLVIGSISIPGVLSTKLRIFGWLGLEKESILAHFPTTNGKKPTWGLSCSIEESTSRDQSSTIWRNPLVSHQLITWHGHWINWSNLVYYWWRFNWYSYWPPPLSWAAINCWPTRR